MKVICPVCGEQFAVNGLGRKRLDIGFNNILKALQVAKSGRPHYTKTALKLFDDCGVKVSPGFVYCRLKKEAEVRGVEHKRFLEELFDDSH